MTKKTIYLIRHGETAYNKKGAVQGRGIDADLNETGKAQARAFYEKYRRVHFDKVYVSSLVRTYQTAELFIKEGIPYQALKGLDEISWGVVEGKSLQETGYGVFKELISKWRKGDSSARLEGGESVDQVAERQKEAMKEILKNKEESIVLITMHGRAMRILLCRLLGYPYSEMDQFEHMNTCLYILEYDYGTDRFELKVRNEISHLKGIHV